jgi:hypothetical protein
MVLADLRWSGSLALRNEHGDGTWICTLWASGSPWCAPLAIADELMRNGSIEGRHLQILLKRINRDRRPA